MPCINNVLILLCGQRIHIKTKRAHLMFKSDILFIFNTILMGIHAWINTNYLFNKCKIPKSGSGFNRSYLAATRIWKLNGNTKKIESFLKFVVQCILCIMIICTLKNSSSNALFGKWFPE